MPTYVFDNKNPFSGKTIEAYNRDKEAKRAQEEAKREAERKAEHIHTVIDHTDSSGEGYYVNYDDETDELTFVYSTECGYAGGEFNLDDFLKELFKSGYINIRRLQKEENK